MKRSVPQRAAALLALAVLALGTGLSLLLSVAQSRHNQRQADEAFTALTARLVTQLQDRLTKYQFGLRGARGAALTVRFDQLSRARFRVYSESRDLDKEFPGARGIGIIRRVAKADEAQFVALARRDGKPSFGIRELSNTPGDRYIIQYIEPSERNEQAIGLDIASEANRRAAAEAAMRSGEPTLTAPITLVQAEGKQLRSFLLLLPIYSPAADLTTPEAREQATEGWSYAPLVVDEVLADFDLNSAFTLMLRDIDADEVGVFFSSPGHAEPAASGLVRRVPVPIYGRRWQAELKATSAFVAGLHLVDPRWRLFWGVGISCLLAGLSAVVAQSRARALQVRAEQARRAAIVQSATDAVIGESPDGIVTDWNPGAEQLFGISAEHAIGREVASLILPADRRAEDVELRAKVGGGELVAPFDTTRLRADGQLIDVSVTIAPIIGQEGRRIGFAKTIRDISAAKRAAQQIAAMNSGLEQQVKERTALLDAAQRDLRNILDAVPSLVSYWDRDMRNRFANSAYQEWLGWDPANMPGKHISEFAGEQLGRALPLFEGALRGEAQTFETKVSRPDGGLRHGVAHFLPDVVDGEVRGFYLFVYDVTAQTLAQEKLAIALRDNQALLRAVNEHAIVSVTDPQGRITDANERFCEISGYRRDELVGSTHARVSSGRHDAPFWQDVWRVISSGKPWRGEVCNRRKDGSLYWVDTMIAPFVGSDEKIERYIAIRFDITAAKQNEAALKVTNERIAMAADAAGIGIWEWDILSNVLTWDDWMYRLYGQPASSRTQPYTLWSSSLHPDDRERSEGELNAALNGESPFDTEFRIFQPDGELRYLKANAKVIRDASGKALRMTGVNFDISKRKRAEQELLETSSLLHTVLESASEVSIIAGDPNLVIKVFNPGAERLLGYSASEVVNKSTPMLFHDSSEVEVRAKALSELSGAEVVGGAAFVHPLALGTPHEWTYVRKDGERVAVSLIVTAMYGQDGELFGYLGIAHDVTRQKQYEATLRDAMHAAEAASEAKSQFLANISHEIRTPLNAVLGLSYLLGQTRLDSEQATFLSKIHLASRTLLSLLNDVLDVSKIEAGELLLERAPFSLSRLLQEVAELTEVQASAKNISFASDIDPTLPLEVEGDVTRLNQILTNLLSNAVKFTAEGTVTLVVQVLARSTSEATVRFAVRDTGLGIAAEIQPRLFQPFAQADASTTRRFGGTGLGLSIVKQLALMMNGEVGLESTPGFGSTFWVTLPLSLATRPSTQAPSQPAPRQLHALSGVRMLVVDDSEINLFVAQRILVQEGARVTLASNGREAVALAEGHDFDVVLMDIQMPVMDGYQATEVIRQERDKMQLPIIALTADARPSERERALRAGMNAFLSKPFEPQDLVSCVSRALSSAGRRRAPVVQEPLELEVGGVSDSWPELNGIDTSEVRRRFDGDQALFRSLMRSFVADFHDVAPPLDLREEQAVRSYVALMHRLRGAAGQLSARAIAELAERIALGFSSGKVERVLPLAKRLASELESLRQEARTRLSGEYRAKPAASDIVRVPTPAVLLALLEQLRQQNLAVLDQVEQLASWGRKAWGEESFSRFAEHVASLRFNDAAKQLEAELVHAMAARDGASAMPS